MGEQIEVKQFNCPKCGGQLNLYTPDLSKTVACIHCGSVLDISTEDGKLLAKYREKTTGKPTPIIPLGSRGNLRGEDVIVIGFMVRTIVVDHIRYSWSEYLLFHSPNEFRWLTEYQGHWNFIKATSIPKGSGQEIQHLDFTFKHFQGLP